MGQLACWSVRLTTDPGRCSQVLKQRLRRLLFPKVTSSQRCGHCLNCRVPSRKQACSTRRREMIEQGLGASS
jgi:hypothetical protein